MVERATVSDAPVAPPSTAQPADIKVTPLPAASSATGEKPTGAGRMRIEAVPAGAPVGDPRPGWLPEKFKSPEELAQAYGQLEQRLGALSHMPAAPAPAAPANPAAPQAAPEGAQQPQPAAGGDLQARLMQEYAATGQVSPQLRQEFVQRTGLSDTFIDQQLGYLQHQGKQAHAMATQRLGGEAAVKELMTWAKGRLSVEEQAAFNRLVYSGDEASARLAVDGLAAQFEAEVGRAPRIIAGRRPQGDYGGLVPFQSEQEFLQAQRDPKYAADPAFRAQVVDRLNLALKLGTIS